MTQQHPSEFRSLLRLAIPLAAVSAGVQLMGLVDTAIVGRLGARELAAVGLANGIFFALSVCGIGTMMGLDPLVSQAVGAGDEAAARRSYWQGVWLSLGVTAALTIPIALSPLLLEPAGVDAGLVELVRAYLLPRMAGLWGILLYTVNRAYLQARGNTRPMVYSIIVGNVVNAGTTWLLVFGGEALPWWTGPLQASPAMGVFGAGVATTLSAFLQAAITSWAIGLEPAGAAKIPRRPDGRAILRAFGVGLPIGLQYMAEVGIFALVGVLVGRLGATEMAAHQISLSLASFTFSVAMGMSAAASVRVGRAVGAGDGPGIRRAGFTAIVGGGGFMSLGALIFVLFPRQLAGLLTDDPGAIETALPLLFVAAVFQITDGIQAVGAGCLRGAGDTRFAFLANLAGHYAVGLPVALLLGMGMGMGVNGLWWGLCAGLTAVAITLLLRFRALSSRPIARLHATDPAPAA